MWCGEKQSEARRYRVLEGEGFNIKEESQARSWTQEDLLVKPEDVSPSGDGTASAKSPRRLSCVAAVEGLVGRMAEDGVRETTGGQTGQGFAGPCEDRGWSLER